ncbi:MAG: hypothetical protein GEU99_15830 [Luteitalea sp.]|nr:hypothetical protein [Luteitalea sp.]
MSPNSSRMRLAAGFALVAATWLLPPSLDAQVLYGSIVGTVKDSSDAAVPGATVTATATETNLVLTGVTNEAGNFTIANVLPGPYDVKVELQGFREFVRTGVPITANTISRVDATLEIGELAETITVASEAALLQTDRADVHTELKAKEVTDLPLPAYRSYQSLMNLVPGATPATEQNALTDSPARSLRTFVNGQNPNNNATKTDGATNVNLWLPHHVMYVSPAETIDTVNISTSSFSAEQGQAGGAAITVLTKSGTNQLSGSAFEFFNNESLNARDFFDPEKLPIDRNIVGGTLGGPILTNKLFFFGSYEGFFERSTAFDFLSVPTTALRGGDFGNARNEDGSAQTIYDPLTGNADGTGRQPFANNVIPADRINPVAEQLLDFYPLPNAGDNEDDATRNYLRENDTTVDRNNFDVKINWNRSSSHQIWGKYSQMNATVGNLFYLGVDGSGNGDTKVYQTTFGHTWTLSPTLVLDSTFGFSRQDQQVAASDFELGFFGRDVLGIPGTNGGSGQFANDERYSGFPQFDFADGGFTDLGNNAGWNPLFRDERTYAITTNLTKVARDHELRFGYSGNYLYLDHWQPEVANPRGRFAFAGDITGLNASGAQTPNFYNEYAAFLLGLSSVAAKSIQFELMTVREWQHALYINDRWQLNDRMTLNLGLRYEYYPLMTRADRGIERLDLDTMEVLLGGVGGNPDDLGINVSSGLFAPRLGFVYRLDQDTVFRTGYGVTYNPLPFARPLRGFYPLTIGSDFDRDTAWTWATTLEDGIPETVGPDLSTGRVPLPPSVDMRTPESDLSRGYIQSWNVAIERRLPADVSVDLAYVGTKGTDGFADLDINASETPGGGNESRPLFDEFGRNRDLKSWGPRVSTEYHALQVAVNRPFRNGFLLKGAYTWSKSMGETTNGEDGWVGLPWNAPSQLDRNYALQPFDRTHVFQLGFLYELPFAKDATGITKALAHGWQVNGLFFAYTGVPFTVTADAATSIDMPGNWQTANQVAEPTVTGAIGDDGPYYETSAWAQPEGEVFGDSGRSSVRGPGGWNTDLSLFRSFPMGSTRRLELRAEAFNVFNHPVFGTPAHGTTGTVGVGDATHSVTAAQFMQIFNTQVSPRTIRLGLRFSF